MDSIKDDPEIASEVMAFLGRELKAARKRISELERELDGQRQNSVAVSSNADTERTEPNTLTLSFEALEDENIQLRDELKGKSHKLTSDNHGSETDTEVNKLKTALVKAQEMCKQYCEEKLTLQSAYDKLDIQLKTSGDNHIFDKPSSDEQNTQLSLSDRDIGTSKNPLPDSDKEIQEQRKGLNHIMYSLPSVQDAPLRRDLKPVFQRKKGIGISEYLDSGFSCQHLYFEKRLVWCNPESQHALAIGPLYVYEEQELQEGRWHINKEFTSMEGETRELFFRVDQVVYYAGSYKCHPLREQIPLGIVKWDDIPSAAIADLVATLHPVRRGLERHTIEKLFQDGVLKVDCLGLQCVGFNHVLYDKLRGKFQLEHSNKRKDSTHSDEDNESNRQQKKKKRLMK